MKAEVRFQPKPGADFVMVTAEVSDDLPTEKLIEAVSLAMKDAASENPQTGPFVVNDGKLVPFREYRKAAGI